MALKDYLNKYAANLDVMIYEPEEEAELDQEDLEIWNMVDESVQSNSNVESTESNSNEDQWEPPTPSQSNELPESKPMTPKALLKVTASKRSRSSDSDNSFEKKPTKKATKRGLAKKSKVIEKANTTLSSDEEIKDKITAISIKCPSHGVMLSDEHMIAAIKMLKNQFSHIGGLVDTLRFQKDLAETFDLQLKAKTVFIIHSNGNHWVIIEKKMFFKFL